MYVRMSSLHNPTNKQERWFLSLAGFVALKEDVANGQFIRKRQAGVDLNPASTNTWWMISSMVLKTQRISLTSTDWGHGH